MDLFNKIASLCAERGISFEDLSLALGFSRGTVRTWKKTSPSVDKAAKVAAYFGVSVDYLMGNSSIRNRVEDVMDDDLFTISRLRNNMSQKNKTKMMELLKIQFEEDFPDDDALQKPKS